MGRDVQRVHPASSRRQAGRDASAFANTDIKNTDVRPAAGRASTFVLFISISLSLNVSVYMHPKKTCHFSQYLRTLRLIREKSSPENENLPGQHPSTQFSRRSNRVWNLSTSSDYVKLPGGRYILSFRSEKSGL